VILIDQLESKVYSPPPSDGGSSKKSGRTPQFPKMMRTGLISVGINLQGCRLNPGTRTLALVNYRVRFGLLQQGTITVQFPPGLEGADCRQFERGRPRGKEGEKAGSLGLQIENAKLAADSGPDRSSSTARRGPCSHPAGWVWKGDGCADGATASSTAGSMERTSGLDKK